MIRKPPQRLTMRTVADKYVDIRSTQVERGTWRSEQSTLNGLVAWWDATRRSPRNLTAGDMEDYLYGSDGLVSRLAPSTFNLRAQQLTAFTRWAAARGHMQHEIVDVIRRRRDSQPRNRLWLRADQLRDMYETVADPWERFAMAFAACTAGRDQELCSRQRRHVDLQRPAIYWDVFKSHKVDSSMPIPATLDAEIRRWLVAYQDLCGPVQPDWYLIPRRWREGSVFTYNPVRRRDNLSELTKTHLARVLGLTADQVDGGALRYEGTHVLRRSAARAYFEQLVDGGTDFHKALSVTAAWLHHADPKQTAYYIGVEWFRSERDKLLNGAQLFQPAQPEKIVRLEVAR